MDAEERLRRLEESFVKITTQLEAEHKSIKNLMSSILNNNGEILDEVKKLKEQLFGKEGVWRAIDRIHLKLQNMKAIYHFGLIILSIVISFLGGAKFSGILKFLK